MNLSAHDVATVLENRLPALGEVKLQKLLYYCQGCHLAFTGERLFAEDIVAWANGPAVAEVWRARAGRTITPPARPVPSTALGTIEYVVAMYGRFSGNELIQRTHDEAPWKLASEDPFAPENPPLTDEVLRNFFRSQLTEIDAWYGAAREDSQVLRLLSQALEERHAGRVGVVDDAAGIVDRIRRQSA